MSMINFSAPLESFWNHCLTFTAKPYCMFFDCFLVHQSSPNMSDVTKQLLPQGVARRSPRVVPDKRLSFPPDNPGLGRVINFGLTKFDISFLVTTLVPKILSPASPKPGRILSHLSNTKDQHLDAA